MEEYLTIKKKYKQGFSDEKVSSENDNNTNKTSI